MNIVVVGANYKTAPVEVRERLAIPQAALPDGLQRLRSHLDSAVLLSTCNRTEIYSVSSRAGAVQEKVTLFLSQVSGLPRFLVTSLLYTYQQQEAAKHLFRVACGLDSLVYGEAQILGQVRHALEHAQGQGLASPPLTRLFRDGIRLGRRVRSETKLGHNAASVSSASVEMAGQLLKGLAGRKILVVGAGRIAGRAAQTLQDKGATGITVINRTYEHGAALAKELNVACRPFSELVAALSEADLAIVATAATDYVISLPDASRALGQRPNRHLHLIDLSVPRNIDPRTARLKGASLYDIDDLRAVSEANLEARRQEGTLVEAMVDAEANKFMEWLASREALPTLVALRSRAETIRQKEMAKTLNKLPGLPDDERWRLEAMTRAIVNKLLHNPSIKLRQSRDGHDYRQAISEVFGIKDEPE